MTSDHRETLEADARKLMAQHANIQPRGYDTIRQRNDLHRRIDQLIDTWTASFDPRYAAALHAPDDQGHPNQAICGICRCVKFAAPRGARWCLTCDEPKADARNYWEPPTMDAP